MQKHRRGCPLHHVKLPNFYSQRWNRQDPSLHYFALKHVPVPVEILPEYGLYFTNKIRYAEGLVVYKCVERYRLEKDDDIRDAVCRMISNMRYSGVATSDTHPNAKELPR